MNRSGVNRKTLIGVESTPGTAVAANRYTPTLSWNLNRERDTKTFKAQGSKTPSAHVLHKQMAKGSVEGILDYNSAMYLFDGNKDTLYRIHGTNQPEYIGQAISSGCIRMTNEDVIDLYKRVKTGTVVVVLSPKQGDSPFSPRMASVKSIFE